MRKEKRYLGRYEDRLERLEQYERKTRHRDATIGLALILMSLGWNLIAEFLNQITLLSFTYNKGWGFFQMSMLLIGTAFLVCAVWKVGFENDKN